MRKQVIAGNWKMNLGWDEALTLVTELIRMEQTSDWSNREVYVFPPVLYVRQSIELVRQYKSAIRVGVQDCSSNTVGAFTGEIAASQARSVGAQAVLIGHSERRAYHHESADLLFQKLERALEAKLTPFFCLGEDLQERRAGNHFKVIGEQLKEVTFKLSKQDFSQIVLAYEPVWAIGTGETASPEQAQEMHAFIRREVIATFGPETGAAMRILYGGSMNAENAAQLLSQPDVDGGLIGGASLSSTAFAQIIEA